MSKFTTCNCPLCAPAAFEALAAAEYPSAATAAGNGKLSLSSAGASAAITRDHVSWAGADLRQPTVLTYSFIGTAPATMPESAGGFQPFSAAQIRAAELALQGWGDVANIQFQRLGGSTGSAGYSDAGTIRFGGYSTGASGAAGFTYQPGTRPDAGAASVQGDGWYNTTVSYVAAPKVFGTGQWMFAHEVGHALGLSHPDAYNATGSAPITYENGATYFEDSSQYTIMSYFSERSTGANFGGAAPAAPLIHDIAAIQAVYGANLTAFLGDTVYGFNSTADRPWFTAAANSPIVFAVWDAGGDDTFDFSGYSQAQLIDLRAGRFSDVGGLTANVSIADGAVIENAHGGSGADQIIGNAAANFLRGMSGADSLVGLAGDDTLSGNLGADTLTGGDGADLLNGGRDNDLLLGDSGNDTVAGDLGNDTLYAGAGADLIVFRTGAGADLLMDFNGAEGDRIQLEARMTYVLEGGNTLNFGGGDVLVIWSLAPANLSEWLVYV